MNKNKNKSLEKLGTATYEIAVSFRFLTLLFFLGLPTGSGLIGITGRVNDIGPRLVRAFNQEFLHQLGVVHPHYEEWGC